MTQNGKRLGAHLSYANVVATLALFAALTTGGAYAASQLGKNSVGAKQLRKGAVDSRALANGGVSTRDLAAKIRTRLTASERASVTGDGRLDSGTAANVLRNDPNRYTVRFRRSVARCSYAATLAVTGTGDPEAGSATISGSGGREVTINTFDASGNPVPASFDLLVVC